MYVATKLTSYIHNIIFFNTTSELSNICKYLFFQAGSLLLLFLTTFWTPRFKMIRVSSNFYIKRLISREETVKLIPQTMIRSVFGR